MNKVRRAIIEGAFFTRIFKKIVRDFKKLKKKIRTKWWNFWKCIDQHLAMPSIKSIIQNVPIDNNTIMFVTSRGSYNCNPKAIADEIIKRKLPLRLVWVVRKENLNTPFLFPPELELVARNSYEFYQAAASAKIWIDNSVNISYMNVPKKPEQIFIETWHGTFGLKRFETNEDKTWLKMATKSGNNTNYCMTNSSFENKLFKETFWKNAEMLEYGHPRNDILFLEGKEKEKIVKEVRKYFHIPSNKKILLYAPTYRESRDLSAYTLDYVSLSNALTERFGGEWVILSRLHFLVRKMAVKAKVAYPDFVIDATDYPDIQNLLVAADVGITDYSSWICDYVLTRRPAFIFATDLGEFADGRGFYYPFTDTPFPVAEKNNVLLSNIRNFDQKKYISDCNKYLDMVGCCEDGHAAERIVDKIEELIAK